MHDFQDATERLGPRRTAVGIVVSAAHTPGLMPSIAVTLAIALAVEIVQALDRLGALGLASNELARAVLGGAFDRLDLVAYATGAVLVGVAERFLRR
jgi:hypothetical protein